MKTIIITGTTRGLGKAFFSLLTKNNYYVITIDRRPLQEHQKDKKNTFIIEDLSNPNELTERCQLEKHLPEHVEEIIFINNAAILGSIGSIGNLDEDSIVETININLVSPILLTNRIIEISKNRGCGLKILNISTGAAKRPIAGWSLYCSTKSAMKMFCDVATVEGIDTLSIDPGVMNTDMQETIRKNDHSGFPMHQYFVELAEEDKLNDPEDVAQQLLIKLNLI